MDGVYERIVVARRCRACGGPKASPKAIYVILETIGSDIGFVAAKSSSGQRRRMYGI